jgi:UDP-glucuronate decarboxylase
MAKRVLVTGGAGFVGSHLCETLIAKGYKVICVDNYFTGNKRNILSLIKNSRFEAIRHDVTEKLSVEVDEIYNLACPASPIHYQYDPIHTAKTSVLGAINLLELARVLPARILQASTSEVYGDPEVHPQVEGYRGSVSVTGPRACYDEGKRCAETLFYDYHRMHKIDVRVARIFNTYGPRMHPNDGRVVSNFIVRALTNKPLEMYGNGSQTRSFCYVDDLVDGLIRLMNADAVTALPINLGNPVEMTVRELAEKVVHMSGSRSPLVCRPLPQDDPRQRRPDISRARKLLNWTPRVKLDEGLRLTIAYFDAVLSANRLSAETLPAGVAMEQLA